MANDASRISSAMGEKPPCYGCTLRDPHCHGACGKYAAWRERLNAVNAARKEYDRSHGGSRLNR